MLIKFQNGNEQHVSNEVGRGFITAGLAEEVKKVVVPAVPQWSVIRDASGYVAIKLELGTIGPGATARDDGGNPVRGVKPTPQSVSFYHGDPDSIHDRRRWTAQGPTGEPYCSAFGRQVPAEIIDQYRKARKDKKACAPAMPLLPIHSNANDDARAEAAFRNSAEKLFKPVVPEHEALADYDTNSQLPTIVIPKVGEEPYFLAVETKHE
jgi:hypothetical protein